MRVILRFLLLFPLLSGCSSNSSNQKDRYEYDDVMDKHISYSEVFNVSEDRYHLYYYQVNCYHCHGIKSKVIYYALNSDNGFYFIEITKDEGFLSHSKEETIGTSDPLKAFSMMTPQLSIVENGVIVETYLGSEEILIIIE